jgi:hypothetical protein
MASDFEQVLQALPQVAEHSAAPRHIEATAELAPTASAGARRVGAVLVEAARRNASRVSGEPLSLVALAMTDAMVNRRLVVQPEISGFEVYPRDICRLLEALEPVQQQLAVLDVLQLRALEHTLGAETGDLRYLDWHLIGLADLITRVAGNLTEVASLENALADIYKLGRSAFWA